MIVYSHKPTDWDNLDRRSYHSIPRRQTLGVSLTTAPTSPQKPRHTRDRENSVYHDSSPFLTGTLGGCLASSATCSLLLIQVRTCFVHYQPVVRVVIIRLKKQSYSK